MTGTAGDLAARASHPRTVKPPRAPQLNLGSGRDYREGWENLDVNPGGRLKVDTDWNFLETPWPYPDSCFDLIFSSHVFEHIPHTVPGTWKDGFLVVLDECWRVLKPGGRLVIVVPHPEGKSAWSSATHTRLVYPEQFREVEKGAIGTDYYADSNFRLAVVKTKRWPLFKGRWRWLDAIYKAAPWLGRVMGVTPQEFRFELVAVK